MTTTIKVIAHSWPVEITTTDHGAGCTTDIVEPNSERDFYVTSTRSLGIVELPERKAEAVADDDAGEASGTSGAGEAEAVA